MSHKPLHIETAARYQHNMHVIMEYCYIHVGIRKVDDEEIETVPFVIK
jgi:hypothetical protein